MNKSVRSEYEVSVSSTDQILIGGTPYDLETILNTSALLSCVLSEMKGLIEINGEMEQEIKRMEEQIKINDDIVDKLSVVDIPPGTGEEEEED